LSGYKLLELYTGEETPPIARNLPLPYTDKLDEKRKKEKNTTSTLQNKVKKK
jgi:hypothetical protein